MEKIKKFIECEIEKADAPNTFNFIASTQSRDRQGDVIVQSGWKLGPFKKNPVILWAHDYSQPPVGKAVDVTNEGGKLKIKVEFASAHYPFAAMIEKMVADKFINAVSVGFSVYKDAALTEEEMKSRPDMPYGRQLWGELLEVSMVPVPANAEALGTRAFAEMVAKGFKFEPEKPGEPEKKSDLLRYLSDDGAVDPRLLKACFGAVFGARGGVPIPECDKKAVYNHLARVAREVGIDVPEFRTYSPEEFRSIFSDVWSEELLDIVTAGMDADTKALASSYLLKGERRAGIQATVDGLQKLLDATEHEPFEVKDFSAMRLEHSINLLTENISKVADFKGR